MLKSKKKVFKKSQTVMIDLLIAFAIFVLITSLIGVLWNIYTVRFAQHLSAQDKWIKGFQVTDILVRSAGVPSNWEKLPNPQDVKIIGLASDDRVLSPEKVNAFFANLTKDNISQKFNIDGYNFNITIKDLHDRYVVSGNSTGLPISNNLSVTIRRYVEIDGQKRVLELSLFQK